MPQPPQNNNPFYHNRPFNPLYNNQPSYYHSPNACIVLLLIHRWHLRRQINGFGQGSSSGIHFGHDNQDYYQSQDGSAPIEDDSPIEKVAPVKAKKVTKCASKAKKNDNKETTKPWTTEEEVALCRA
nr:hypothetical protein [Tanacetum cinerariifolium]GEZ75410.1 hypothetical protein [Tanacetum cinerariifolium]